MHRKLHCEALSCDWMQTQSFVAGASFMNEFAWYVMQAPPPFAINEYESAEGGVKCCVKIIPDMKGIVFGWNVTEAFFFNMGQ